MINLLGFAASLAVLASFLMQTMLSLRLVAIGSNILFIAYCTCAHLPPVLCLHIALLPINIARIAYSAHSRESGNLVAEETQPRSLSELFGFPLSRE